MPPLQVTLPADAVFDAVLRIDAAGRISGANEAACRLFGVQDYPPPPGELIGQTVLEATHVRALAELCSQVATAARRDVPREIEARLVGPQERVVRARATPAPLEQGGGVLLVLEDQTELIRLRTVRTEFVANVSHELRTPLASIRAMAETLQNGAMADPAAGPRFLETIIREADRLVRLSEDLLELSRAESGRREKTRFDLGELLVDVAARLAAQAERRKVALDVRQPDQGGTPLPIEIEADRYEIDQVLFNLLDNALKYTPEGGTVTASCSPKVSDSGAPLVRVTVEDTGIGILSQDLPRIFERFWRADRARRFQGGDGQVGGTGLGLAIVKHIVEAHGGSVHVESELGHGSHFAVTLPAVPPVRPPF
jgi:Signal transduction histidine kinase